MDNSTKKNNKKLNTILLIVLAVLVIAIIIVAVVLHNKNKANRAAFNEDMKTFCKEYNFNITENGMEYTVKMSAATWDAMDTTARLSYCDVIAAQITTSAWQYHIFEEPWLPVVYFYVGESMVAAGSPGSIELK